MGMNKMWAKLGMVLLVMLTMRGGNAVAEQVGDWSFYFTYGTLTAEIQGYSGTATDVILPSRVTKTDERQKQDAHGTWYSYYETNTYSRS